MLLGSSFLNKSISCNHHVKRDTSVLTRTEDLQCSKHSFVKQLCNFTFVQSAALFGRRRFLSTLQTQVLVDTTDAGLIVAHIEA